jgi:TPR repeat protein
MSAPVREPADGPSKDGLLDYAPKKIRDAESDPIPGVPVTPVKGDPAPPSAAPESAEPPWKRSRQREAFAGDAVSAARRNKLALAPDRLPDPPPPRRSTSPKYVLAGRLAGVVVVTAVGVVGYQLGSSPRDSSPQLALRPSQSSQQKSERSEPAAYVDSAGRDSKSAAGRPAAGGLPTATPADYARGGAAAANAVPVVYPPPSAEPAPAPVAANAIVLPSNEQKSHDAPSSRAASELTVGTVRPQQADEAARLTVSTAHAGANATVVIGGLAPGSALSAGRPEGPNTWRLAVEELAGTAITPPRGFVGTMALTLELHLADNTVADRKGLQLEWSGRSASAPATSPPRRHDADEIALMMKSGADLMANGDISAARLMYQRAAEAGEATAALALAETYDPLVLRRVNPKGGITPDVAQAHIWYEKAKDLGSAVAPERLERLARLPESPE